MASKLNLVTATKKESMGICFVGKVGIKEFLSQYITSEPGPIIDQNGIEIGQHDGAIFYTIGQRHGLNVGGGLPIYVTNKDILKNAVYVTSILDDPKLWHNKLSITSQHWINTKPKLNVNYQFRTRHLAPLVNGHFTDKNTILLDSQIRASTPGQSVVVYNNDLVLGGGVIN